MAEKKVKLKVPGWISFVIACVIFLIGDLVFTGSIPGVTGVFKWWYILILLILWGAVSAGLEAIASRKKKGVK